VMLPDAPDEDRKTFLAGWAEDHAYDPRAGMPGTEAAS
jgi:hypothetical protein